MTTDGDSAHAGEGFAGPRILLVSPDLLSTSRIAGLARDAGGRLETLRSLEDQPPEGPFQLVLLDLQAVAGDPAVLVSRVLATLGTAPLGKAAIASTLGQRQPSGPLHTTIRRLVDEGALELTIPDKPNSRLQKYRLTPAGKARLAATRKGAK